VARISIANLSVDFAIFGASSRSAYDQATYMANHTVAEPKAVVASITQR
jgi:hypothetical protein